MSVLFSGRDMLEIAVNIEKNGQAFYQAAVKSARNDKARVAFDYFAGEERKHIRIFQSLLDSLPPQPLPETYSGEYALYVKNLSEGHVFSGDEAVKSLVAKAANEAEVIHLALSAERDSLLFYWEMRGLIRQQDLPVVDRIMDEERSHVRQLNELKGQIGG